MGVTWGLHGSTTFLTYGVWGSTKCENEKYEILTFKIGDRV